MILTPMYPSVYKSTVYQPSFKAPTYDIFTGLKDKTTLLNDIRNRMEKKEDISLIMFDMDNFKSVNELLGYKAGDEFIKAIGNDISHVAREHKTDAYRFGGDEFVVLVMSDTEEENKSRLVEEVQTRISKNEILSKKKREYVKNAKHVLTVNEGSQQKVDEVDDISKKYEVFNEIYKHSTIAKQDPYILQSMYLIGQKRAALMKQISEETHEGSMEEKVEEYRDKYNRSHEIHRVKKWIRDFEEKGFHISSGCATFTPDGYKGKEPIDLINETGEILKRNKHQ